MSYLGFQDLQNSRRRTSWLRTNAPGLIIAFALAAPTVHQVDKQTNFINEIAARLTNSAPSKVPFAYRVDHWAERQYKAAAPLVKGLAAKL